MSRENACRDMTPKKTFVSSVSISMNVLKNWITVAIMQSAMIYLVLGIVHAKLVIMTLIAI